MLETVREEVGAQEIVHDQVSGEVGCPPTITKEKTMPKRIRYILFSVAMLLILLYAPQGPGRSLSQGPVPQMAPTRPAPFKPPPPGTGFIPPPMDLSHLTGQRMPEGVRALALPSKFDWRNKDGKNYVTSVKNQLGCGACYAFASIANIESRLLVEGEPDYDFSENNAKECNWRELNNYIDSWGRPWGSCDGGNNDMMANLFSKRGTVLESCDPYDERDVACKSTCSYQKTLLDWRIINGPGIPATEVLKSYIHNYGPVYTSMYTGYYDAWYYEFSAYDGSYTLYYPGTEEPNHAVLIVGWDDSLSHAGPGTGG
ncbi:MAG: C1 family peptidase, partial [Chloroflexota bacterium]|nr:C1 family peptidase [Chloroflexota bacterium]